MGKLSRDKGARTEREVVQLHRRIGVASERVPLSGATAYRANGEDVDIYPWGADAGPLCCQVKRLGSERGYKGVIDALGDSDALFLRFDAEQGRPVRPMLVLVPWATWEKLIKRGR